MSGAILNFLTREELEAEVVRLRAALEGAGLDAHRLSIRQGARDHRRRMGVAAADLAASEDLVFALQASQIALAGSEARQRAIFESSIDFAMVVTDPNGIVTDWNPGAERVMAWSAAEMRGQSAERFFTPEDRAADRVAVEMKQALQQGRAADERWHLRKDGERFWASGELMPLYDANEAHLGFVKILRDRTAEHLAGIVLKETQERYRLASKATNDAVWDWDLTTNHVLWNKALEEVYGHLLVEVEMTGDWWIAQIHPDDRARITASIHAVIDGIGTSWTDKYRFRCADGSYAEVLDRGHVIRNAEGRACRMIGAMLDVTQLHSVETALRESERQLIVERGVLQAVFRQAPVGISIAYADGHGELNAWMDQMLGHTVGESSDQRYTHYGALHADGRAYAVEDYPTIRALRGGETLLNVPMTYRNSASHEVRRWEVSSTPVRDADGMILAAVSVIIDVEERHRAEEHQAVLNHELSHRLKNTLAIVQAIVTQTLRTAADLEGARDALDARLIALGKAHDILLTGQGVSADIREVISGALEVHEDLQPGRFALQGPSRVLKKSAIGGR